jgi:hypothetical protein
LLAVWSRVEGDSLVIQMRFSAPPFRNIFTEAPIVAFSGAQGMVAEGSDDGPFGLCENNFSPFDQFCVPDNCIVALDFERDGTDLTLREYPPTGPVISPSPGPPAVDRCAFRLGRESPLLEERVPYSFFSRADGSVHYGVLVDEQFPTDFTWISGSPALITSMGGRADDDSDLVSFCDLNCPTGAP